MQILSSQRLRVLLSCGTAAPLTHTSLPPWPCCVSGRIALWQAPSGTASGGAALASEAAAHSDGDRQHGAALEAWAAEQGYQWVDVRRQGPHMAPGADETQNPPVRLLML